MFKLFRKKTEEQPYNTSGIMFDKSKKHNPWRAYLYIKRHYIHIGNYSTKKEAIRARYEFIKRLI